MPGGPAIVRAIFSGQSRNLQGAPCNMIEFIHKYPILIKVILTITTVAFVVSGYLISKDQQPLAAKVEDQPITMQEYQEALANLTDFYNKIYQGNVPPGFIDSMKLDKAALDGLIERKMVMLAAKDLNIKVSDTEIADAVQNNSSFKDPDGGFSKDNYMEVLKLNNLTPQAYEKSLREDLTLEKFRKMVTDSVEITEDEVRAYYKDQMKMTGGTFDEKAYEENKDNYARQLASTMQNNAYRSLIEGLKSKYKVEKLIQMDQPAGEAAS